MSLAFKKISISTKEDRPTAVFILWGIHLMSNIILPIFAVYYFYTNQNIYPLSEADKLWFFRGTIVLTFFLFWFQFILMQYLPEKISALLQIIFFPYLSLLIQWFFTPQLLFGQQVAYMGLQIVSGSILAFAMIVFVGPIVSKVNNFRRWNSSDWKFHVGATCGALIFIVPGLQIIRIFLKLTLANTHHLEQAILISSFFAVLFSNGYQMFKKIKTSSIYK
jgi:hypothetical protein